MDAVNWLLLNAGDAVLATWSAVKVGAAWAWSIVDTLLDPLLSVVLACLNPLCTKLGDLVYAILSPFPIWIGLTLLSVAAGLIALLAFRYTSNQTAIGRAKDDIKANLLALKLFKDELGVTFRCQLRLLWAIARLQRYMLFPFFVMLPPMLLLLAQMGIRHQWRPLQPGEQTNIELRLTDEAPTTDTTPTEPITLQPNPGLAEIVGVPGADRTVWRITAGSPGRHILQFHLGAESIEKELVVGTEFQRVSAIRTRHNWGAQLLHPAEPCLPADATVASIQILYPHVDSWIHGANWWLLSFFVISMATALIFKPLFNVRF